MRPQDQRQGLRAVRGTPTRPILAVANTNFAGSTNRCLLEGSVCLQPVWATQVHLRDTALHTHGLEATSGTIPRLPSPSTQALPRRPLALPEACSHTGPGPHSRLQGELSLGPPSALRLPDSCLAFSRPPPAPFPT
ncbi:hypothetical protein P7K49_002015 [Saguinus oedipus]|uniref:Uncharacterized protein n=1 Tax=Saguinus oedipus TaxID=9490 RepID=A0ABQ9WG46_SAGOE|nr:hypothetical protein P7K49_002015 [Saguinus oedipus]